MDLTTHLTEKIKNDLSSVNIPTDFTLELRGYSSSYWGRYYVKDNKIVVYALDEQGELYPYRTLIETALHEAIHHYQYNHQQGFVRLKGVMHDLTFNRLYQQTLNKLKMKGVIRVEKVKKAN